ncbi:MAG: polysaccharide biosynthesis C-terminal domain-containing protein [Candidatus Faecousia sp.]|nr:polysaccharide biosynthesis C-terminal domain-containing protein [Candidatus Faecousia sp.]
MSKGLSIAKGALLLTGVNLFLRAVSTAFQVFLSNRLGAEGLGLLQLTLTVGYLAMTLGSAGVRVAAMYLTAQEYGRGRPGGVSRVVSCCLQYGLLVSTAVGLGFYFGADALASRWVQNVCAADALRVMAAFLPATCLNSVMSGWCTACGRLGALVSVEIFERFSGIGLTMVLLRRAADTGAMCSAVMAGSSVSSLLSFLVLYALFCVQRRLTPPLRGLRVGRRLVRLCVPLAANDCLRAGLSSFEQFLIPRGLARHSACQSGLAAYGTIHGMVFPLIMLPASILYALSDLLVPELSRCAAGKRHKRIRYLTDRCFRLSSAFALAVAACFYAAGPALGALVYGSADAGYYIRLFAPMLLFLYLDAIVDGMLKGLGQQMHSVRYNTLTSFLDVVGLFFLLPRLGITGYLISFAVTHLINFFLSVRRLLVVTGYVPNFLPPKTAESG